MTQTVPMNPDQLAALLEVAHRAGQASVVDKPAPADPPRPVAPPPVLPELDRSVGVRAVITALDGLGVAAAAGTRDVLGRIAVLERDLADHERRVSDASEKAVAALVAGGSTVGKAAADRCVWGDPGQARQLVDAATAQLRIAAVAALRDDAPGVVRALAPLAARHIETATVAGRELVDADQTAAAIAAWLAAANRRTAQGTFLPAPERPRVVTTDGPARFTVEAALRELRKVTDVAELLGRVTRSTAATIWPAGTPSDLLAEIGNLDVNIQLAVAYAAGIRPGLRVVRPDPVRSRDDMVRDAKAAERAAAAARRGRYGG